MYFLMEAAIYERMDTNDQNAYFLRSEGDSGNVVDALLEVLAVGFLANESTRVPHTMKAVVNLRQSGMYIIGRAVLGPRKQVYLWCLRAS